MTLWRFRLTIVAVETTTLYVCIVFHVRVAVNSIKVIHSFISPTNAQLICFKILKFTLKYTINAPTCFGLTKPSSGSLQFVLR